MYPIWLRASEMSLGAHSASLHTEWCEKPIAIATYATEEMVVTKCEPDHPNGLSAAGKDSR